MGSLIIAMFGHLYITRGDEKLKEAVYWKIIHGSSPELLYGDIVIPRKDDELLKWFVQRDLGSGSRNKQFGVIVGPTGMDKSAVVRNVCNKDPRGKSQTHLSDRC